MARLSATAVKAATRPGRISDGDGLYLVIKPGGAKSWVCRVQRHGNRRAFGMGSASKVFWRLPENERAKCAPG
tara:strand:- start:300 stop:518 length:219 start_codon:yes stop_codon:yes gene_type:complete